MRARAALPRCQLRSLVSASFNKENTRSAAADDSNARESGDIWTGF